MYHKGLRLDDAYDLVKAQKPNISPNFNFMGQLLDWERQLHGTRSPDSGRCSCSSTDECTCSIASSNGEMHFISSPLSIVLPPVVSTADNLISHDEST